VATLREGVELADEAIKSGKARAVLDQLVKGERGE
jgi:anthranilate phosphoribosyltransferase